MEMPTRSKRTTQALNGPSSTSPYRRILPHDADIEHVPLLVRLDFHRESTILHEYHDATSSIRLVSALDVARALASELDLDSGLLPQKALWFIKTGAGPRIAIWLEPQVHTVVART